MVTPHIKPSGLDVSVRHGEPIPVSVIFMTKNEERAIQETLLSVADFAEVFVVDSGSTDATCQIAFGLGAKVVPFTWDGKYPRRRSGVSRSCRSVTTGVLYLDADERASPALTREIRAAVTSATESRAAFDVELDYCFLGAS
jgi:glycosyltransferase involved in cell wall biosynthesis